MSKISNILTLLQTLVEMEDEERRLAKDGNVSVLQDFITFYKEKLQNKE